MSKPTCLPDVPADVAAEFERVAELLGERAEQIDQFQILMFAHSWTVWRKATAEVARLGNVVMSGGSAVPNPSLTVAHQALGQLIALAKALGINPAERAKLRSQLDDEDCDDE